MTGYVAQVGLSYPLDLDADEALRSLGTQAMEAFERARQSGDPRDVDAATLAEEARTDAAQRAMTDGTLKHVEAGERCDDVPAQSVPWLLAQALICAVDAEVAHG